MKQVVLNIPDNKYLAFINLIKSKFSDIQIKEKKTDTEDEIIEEDSPDDILLISEKSLAEDWLSEEDNRWDEVL